MAIDAYDELRQKNKELGILTNIIQAVHKSSSLEEVYSVALDSLTGFENVDMVEIYLIDEQKHEAVLQAHKNIPEDYIRRAGRIPYPKGSTWKVINTGKILNVENIQKDPDIGPAGRDLGHHSALAVPIFLEEKAIGVIWFLSYKEREFNEGEVNLLSTLGNQIAIAIAKAKLYSDLSKKNRYETIISIVTRTVHQSINLQEVLENAVDSMSRNIDRVDNVSIYLVEGQEAVLKAYRGFSDWFVKRAGRIPYPKGFTWKTIIDGKPSYCADVGKDTVIGPAGRDAGTNSYVSMPIRSGGKTLGALNINSFQKNAFDEEELKLLEIVSQQIEIAINNAQITESLRQSQENLKVGIRQQEGVAQLGQQALSGVDLDLLFNKAAIFIAENLGVEYCNVMELFPDGSALLLRAGVGWKEGYVGSATVGTGADSQAGYTLLSNKPVIVEDLRTETRFNGLPLLNDHGVVSGMSVVIEGRGKPFGVIGADTARRRTFTKDDIYFLQMIANVLAAAIERKQAEENIGNSISLLRATLDSTACGILVVDKKGKIESFNRKFIDMWRIPDSVIAPRDDDQAIAFVLDQLKDPQGFLKKVRKLYSQVDVESYDTLEFKDGRVFERYSQPQRIGERILGRVWSFRDITERMRAEDKIREQAELLDKAQDIIAVRDLENRIIYWNKSAERLYGWAVEEVIGRDADELLYKEEDLPKLIEAKKSVTGKEEWMGELHQVTKDGREVIVESRWTLVRDGEAKPKSILVINADITERKKLEAQVLLAQRLESIGTLAGGIAHDLNNVLTPIMMSLQILRMRFTDIKNQNLLNTLEKSVQRGADLIHQILSFTRGPGGERIIVPLGYLIPEIVKILEGTFSKSIEIHVEIPKDLWNISAEPTQLHQVFMNICVNARDAMPNGGRLSISAENLWIDENYARMDVDARVGSYVVTTVSDTGVGIRAEIMDRVFEPFFTTKGVGKGTGLGLSTAFGIVKGHRGFIHLYSEVGKGTRFRVYLPATETSETKKVEERQLEMPSGQRKLILVVDDESAIREITKLTLETNGYRVMTASDGTEAVALYAQNSGEIRVVIIDMVMPMMDGLAAIRVLHKIHPQVKIIAISGLEEKDGFAEATIGEVKKFLLKPYTAETLLRTLHEVLSKD